MVKLKIFKRALMLLLGVIPLCSLVGQFTESFDQDLSNWNGDVEHFIINEDGQLQLNADEAGISRISTMLNFPEDWEMEILVKMEFAPSDNNKSRIYLLNSGTPETGNGYFINIGENGSNDAIQLFLLDSGSEVLLGSGTMGSVSSDPVNIRISISRESSGFWNMAVDYEGGNLYVPDLELSDATYNLIGEGLLIIECKYSSTRVDKFFFDDIQVKMLSEDNSPPDLLSAEIIDDHSALLIFNELLEETSASNPINYSIPETGNQAVMAEVDKNEVLLSFTDPFVSGPAFAILITGIEDLEGNVIAETRTENLFYAITPSSGDVIINELLFDPYPGMSDFVELYNRSDKLISLRGLEIHNDDREEFRQISNNVVMMPGSYVAFTSSPTNLSVTYSTPAEATIESQNLPGFNNENGNVTLRFQGQLLDAFNYYEDLHSPILNDTEGVSLERISPDLATDNPENWTSGQEVNDFATPGYKNGAFIESITGSQSISLRESYFSPNGDSHLDYAIIDYNLDKSGYLATIDIFNDAGQRVKRLANNVSLATNGFIQWDGITDEAKIGRIGVYIIAIELFHPDGDTFLDRIAVVLSKPVD